MEFRHWKETSLWAAFVHVLHHLCLLNSPAYRRSLPPPLAATAPAHLRNIWFAGRSEIEAFFFFFLYLCPLGKKIYEVDFKSEFISVPIDNYLAFNF